MLFKILIYKILLPVQNLGGGICPPCLTLATALHTGVCFSLPQALKFVQVVSVYSSCSFQKSLHVQLTHKRFQNKNQFKKGKCSQNSKGKKMEAEEHDNVIHKSEKPLQKQCFWITKAEIQ